MSNELLNQQELNLSGVITLDGNKMPAIVHANMMAELTPEFMVMSYIMNSFNINEDKTIIDTGMYSAQGRIGYINELTSITQNANSGDGYYRIFAVLDLENDETYIQFYFMGTTIMPISAMNKTYEYGYQPTASGQTKGHLYDIKLENGKVTKINDHRKKMNSKVFVKSNINVAPNGVIELDQNINILDYTICIALHSSFQHACIGVITPRFVTTHDNIYCSGSGGSINNKTQYHSTIYFHIEGKNKLRVMDSYYQRHNENGNHGSMTNVNVTCLILIK